MANIRAVSFDGDDTLWDLASATTRAADEMAKRLSNRYGGQPKTQVPKPLTVHVLEATRSELEVLHPDWSMRKLRVETFRCVLGDSFEESAINDIVDEFIELRVSVTKLFDDVIDTLDHLAQAGFALGLFSNGNTLPGAVGLAGRFDVEFIGEYEKFMKPDPRAFDCVIGRLGIRPTELLHVGDSRHQDYEAAFNAGAKGLLLDRTGQTNLAGSSIDSLHCLVGRLT